jgi:hypothetical protein
VAIPGESFQSIALHVGHPASAAIFRSLWHVVGIGFPVSIA